MLVCLATLLSVGTRLASLLGYEKFIGEDDFSVDYIDEGKALMKRGAWKGGREGGKNRDKEGVKRKYSHKTSTLLTERRLRERNLREHGVAKVSTHYTTFM